MEKSSSSGRNRAKAQPSASNCHFPSANVYFYPMKLARPFLLSLLLGTLAVTVHAQQNTAKEGLGIVLIKTHLGGYVPTGILAERFGPGATVGLDISYKTSKGWMFSIVLSINYLQRFCEDSVTIHK